MPTDVLLLVALLILLLAMVVAAAESALKAVSRTVLEEQREDGRDVGAALYFKDHPEKARATIQIASTLLQFGLAATLVLVLHHVSYSLPADWYQTIPQPVFLLVLWSGALLLGTSVHVVAVTLVAKVVGAHFATHLAIPLAPVLRTTSTLLSPVRHAVEGLSNVLLRPVGTRAQFMDAVMSEESLKTILEEGTKSGILDPTEHELIESIFEFTETTAREVMIPRKDIVALDIRMQPEEILDLVTLQGFTRLPVYDESLDNVVGIVYSKDILSLVQHRDLIILQDILRPPFIVPETKPISELLREFQRKRIHLAVVADEFGGTEGIITMEDILEEIVGDIRDEYDDEERPVTALPGGEIEVIGSVNISDLNDQISFVLPESEEYDTVGGYVTAVLGRIPQQGETAMDGHIRMTVLEVTDRRVTRVRLEHVPDTNSSANSLH